MKIDFNIDHIDPLGQGVSKSNERVTFIKKTLPGERGDARLISAKKGVEFASLETLTQKSPDRITPECTHFDHCNGCDFLHTTYEKEKLFKLNSLTRQLKKFEVSEIKYHSAPHRHGYRNRLQLHYDLEQKKLGFLNSFNQIVEVPNCLMGVSAIKTELNRLYFNQHWTTLLKGQPKQGHIEIYLRENAVQIKINSHYADGGFTQVNQEMNTVLNEFISQYLLNTLEKSHQLLDLFGGNGNLSKLLSNPTTVVDHYTQAPFSTPNRKFISLDLYQKNALSILKKSCPKIDWMIIDPPRSGLKNLSEFILNYSPKGFIYVSCQSTSFVRDILPLLSLYELKSAHLFDLFPSTHHFETVGIFTRRKLTL